MNTEICVVSETLTCQSVGLMDKFGLEVSAAVNTPLLLEDCCEFVRYVVNYIAAGNEVGDGKLLEYGYWVTKAELVGSNRLTFCELDSQAAEFVFGVNASVSYWRDQHEICKKVGARFEPPKLDQLVVISDGVYEGDEAEGVRYPSPEHMSGWWLTTDRFNGDTATLKTVHAHHLSAKRPDLAKFLALPFGYRFFSPESDIWFDQSVAEAEA